MIFAVTGHRPNRLSASKETELRTSIKTIFQSYPAQEKSLLSGLAEGADQITAEEALALGITLEAILPFSYKTYSKNFNPESKIILDQLMDKATKVITLEPSNDHHPYEHLGDYLIKHSDILISIWDGKVGHGPGGTADVTETALKQNHPTIIISSSSPGSIQYHGFGL